MQNNYKKKKKNLGEKWRNVWNIPRNKYQSGAGARTFKVEQKRRCSVPPGLSVRDLLESAVVTVK